MNTGTLEPSTPRSTASLVIRSALAAAWFELMFFVAIPAAVLWTRGSGWIPPGGASRWLGAALLLACHVVLVLQIRRFIVEGGGTHAPFDPPRQLLRAGAYQRVRNPMYLNYVVIALAEALLYRSLALSLYALALWGLTHFFLVRFEEPSLRRRFGADYEAFAARVPRWLPRFF